jgi:predicted GIY-YIG superfamily endonuclease
MNGETNIPLVRPGQDCVYFLRLRGVIVYVGISNNFYARISSHLARKDMEFNSASFKIVSSREAAVKIEDLLIRGLLPKHNKCLKTKRGREQLEAYRNSPIGLWMRGKTDINPNSLKPSKT